MQSFLAHVAPNVKANVDDLKLGIAMLKQIQNFIHDNPERTFGLLIEQICFAASVPTRNIRIGIRAYKAVILSGRNNPLEMDLANEFKDLMTMIYDYVRSSLVSLAAHKKMDATIVKELMKTEYISKGFLAEMEVAQEETEEEASWLSNYEEDEFEEYYASKIAQDSINNKLEA